MKENRTAKYIEKENEIVAILKTMLDSDANFARPLSEFWRGTGPNESSAWGLYGVWLSGEGGSCINGESVADYYGNYYGSKGFQEFCERHDLDIEWYDPGTLFLLFKVKTGMFDLLK